MKKIAVFLTAGFILLAALLIQKNKGKAVISSNPLESFSKVSDKKPVDPLQITEMRKQSYPGSEMIIEQTLDPSANYNRFIASYKSDGLKIYGLLTVPNGKTPEGGWPAIIFNHGHIPPEAYKTTERYVAYVDGFAKQGFVVFKPDYRGHGNSEGNPEGAYYSTGYTTDVLNALASVKKLSYVNPGKIGMWGHSMGGNITLRAMVVSKDIKAGVIWGGVVGTYKQMAEDWRRTRPFRPSNREVQSFRPTRQQLVDKYGDWNANPDFWASLSPVTYVSDISGPLQLHHGLADGEVPWEFSQSLRDALETAGKPVELYTYKGADHNLSGNAFSIAMARSVEFFKKYLK